MRIVKDRRYTRRGMEGRSLPTRIVSKGTRSMKKKTCNKVVTSAVL